MQGHGKCRLADDTFNHDDSYFPTGPNDKRPSHQRKRVRDIKACKRVCDKDASCTAFHFYLLDPGAYNNCWIWTVEGYTPNGSDKAYCYLKQEEEILNQHPWENWDEEDYDEELEKRLEEQDRNRGPKPTKSLNDWDKEYMDEQ